MNNSNEKNIENTLEAPVSDQDKKQKKVCSICRKDEDHTTNMLTMPDGNSICSSCLQSMLDRFKGGCPEQAPEDWRGCRIFPLFCPILICPMYRDSPL